MFVVHTGTALAVVIRTFHFEAEVETGKWTKAARAPWYQTYPSARWSCGGTLEQKWFGQGYCWALLASVMEAIAVVVWPHSRSRHRLQWRCTVAQGLLKVTRAPPFLRRARSQDHHHPGQRTAWRGPQHVLGPLMLPPPYPAASLHPPAGHSWPPILCIIKQCMRSVHRQGDGGEGNGPDR